MVEPLSIATGVLGLLSACVKIGGELKNFHDGVAIADTAVKALLGDVESFAQVLRLMKDTLGQPGIQSSLQATGHIGNHWNDISKSIKDGQKTLAQLQETLEKVDRRVNVLDQTRKHLRLKGSSEEIALYRQQIKSYRDTMQLSLQTVILWNQVTVKESVDKILPNLEEINHSIRRITSEIDDRMHNLQTSAESSITQSHIHNLINLRNCVKSAATVYSSASTTLGVDHADRSSVGHGSEFGDCFPSEPSEAMLRWISSNTVYEVEEDRGAVMVARERNVMIGTLSNRLDEDDARSQSDSDSDLELEIVQALMKRGKEKLVTKDFHSAERLFRNCLSRTLGSGSLASTRRSPKSEIMTLLLEAYRRQEKWDAAQSLLMDKLAFESRNATGDNGDTLTDMLSLVDVLLQKGDYAEAKLYGRRTLKGYRKLGPEGMSGIENSLRLLIRVCKADGDIDEEDAYGSILSDFLEQTLSKSNLQSSSTSQEGSKGRESSTSVERALPMDADVGRPKFPDMDHHNQAGLKSMPGASAQQSDNSNTGQPSASKLNSPVEAKPTVQAHAEVLKPISQQDKTSSILIETDGLLHEDPYMNADATVSVLPFVRKSLLVSQNQDDNFHLESLLARETAARMETQMEKDNTIDNSKPTDHSMDFRSPREIMEDGKNKQSELIVSQQDTQRAIPTSTLLKPERKVYFHSDETMEARSRSLFEATLAEEAGQPDVSTGASLESKVEPYLKLAGQPSDEYDPFKPTDEPLPIVWPHSATSSSTARLLEVRSSLTAPEPDRSKSPMLIPSNSDSALADLVGLVRGPYPESSIGHRSSSQHVSRALLESGPGEVDAPLADFWKAGVSKPRLMLEPKLKAHVESQPLPIKSSMVAELEEVPPSDVAAVERVKGVFDFYKRRASVNSKDAVVTSPKSPEISRKIVVIGDGVVGKTPLIIRFCKGRVPEMNVPTTFEVHTADIEVDGKHVDLALWDTSGEEMNDRLRPLSYPNSHVILICFDISYPNSLDSVQEKWISEVLYFCEGLPYLLIGLKKDLRDDPDVLRSLAVMQQHPVTWEEAEEVRRKIEALEYLECSAKTGEGVREVFEHAARAALLPRAKKKKRSLRRLIGRTFS